MTNPIKRSETLKPLSRDHHHGLLLCWKIRQGINLSVETERIKSYCDWFWKHHLEEHFQAEEKYLFPILGNDHPMIKQAKSEHRRLKRLFENSQDPEKSIRRIEEELEKHIRFEERILFNEIQLQISETQLQNLEIHHMSEPLPEWDDEFWLQKK